MKAPPSSSSCGAKAFSFNKNFWGAIYMYFFFLEIFHSFSKEEEEEETKRTFFVDCHFFVSLLPISLRCHQHLFRTRCLCIVFLTLVSLICYLCVDLPLAPHWPSASHLLCRMVFPRICGSIASASPLQETRSLQSALEQQQTTIHVQQWEVDEFCHFFPTVECPSELCRFLTLSPSRRPLG